MPARLAAMALIVSILAGAVTTPSLGNEVPAAMAAGDAATATTTDPLPVRLQYRASLAGAPIGVASIEVRIGEDVYQVSGTARTLDWVSTFGDWSNQFAASGRLVDGHRQPVSFDYHERSGARSREVRVHGGELHVSRNGRPRAVVPAPVGLDVLTVLFAHPECAAQQHLHTGRHSYSASRRTRHEASATTAGAEGACSLSVTDDNGDAFDVEITFTERAGLRVPARIVVNTLLAARVDLLNVDSTAPAVPGTLPEAAAGAPAEPSTGASPLWPATLWAHVPGIHVWQPRDAAGIVRQRHRPRPQKQVR